MISGVTGEEFAVDIFIGPVYYQRLRHMVSDKFQVSCYLRKPMFKAFGMSCALSVCIVVASRI